MLEKGYKFLFENDYHDAYCGLIWTINSCREECFKSLRKNERPHNVNSCDKCYCTAGGNGYCNQMFLLHKCLNSLNSQELEWRQSSVLWQPSNLPRPRAVDGSYPEFPIDTDTSAWVRL